MLLGYLSGSIQIPKEGPLKKLRKLEMFAWVAAAPAPEESVYQSELVIMFHLQGCSLPLSLSLALALSLFRFLEVFYHSSTRIQPLPFLNSMILNWVSITLEENGFANASIMDLA